MSDTLIKNYTSRGFQLNATLVVACATMLSTTSQVNVTENLSLRRTQVSFNENSYGIVWRDGSKELNLVVKPIEKEGGLICIVIRATQEDSKTGDFRVIHNINSQVPHENGTELKAKFRNALASLLEKHPNIKVSSWAERGA